MDLSDGGEIRNRPAERRWIEKTRWHHPGEQAGETEATQLDQASRRPQGLEYITVTDPQPLATSLVEHVFQVLVSVGSEVGCIESANARPDDDVRSAVLLLDPRQ